MDRKIRKTAIIVDKNRKPKTKLEKTRKPRNTKTEKPQFLSEKNETQNQESAKSAVTLKIPIARNLIDKQTRMEKIIKDITQTTKLKRDVNLSRAGAFYDV